jgi:hypothetical protein
LDFQTKGLQMSNEMMVGLGVVGGMVLASVAFGLFHIYGGLRDSLTNAKVGSVYNFLYEQPLHGEPERYMARVLEVHRLSQDSINRLNARSNYRKYDTNFQRTTHLVTAQTPDGRIRNFYAERTRNVRRPLLGKFVFGTNMASWLF